jgi:hypothetical protein
MATSVVCRTIFGFGLHFAKRGVLMLKTKSEFVFSITD